MSGATALDLRLPIGALFTVLGLILAGYGLATNGDAALYAPSAGVNVNLAWGTVMLVFGIIFLVMARRATRVAGARLAADTPEGRATERREHATGLER
jgi:hypothetical protein